MFLLYLLMVMMTSFKGPMYAAFTIHSTPILPTVTVNYTNWYFFLLR